jgi:hypothetical protein
MEKMKRKFSKPHLNNQKENENKNVKFDSISKPTNKLTEQKTPKKKESI